jgi:hypothetical protein
LLGHGGRARVRVCVWRLEGGREEEEEEEAEEESEQAGAIAVHTKHSTSGSLSLCPSSAARAGQHEMQAVCRELARMRFGVLPPRLHQLPSYKLAEPFLNGSSTFKRKHTNERKYNKKHRHSAGHHTPTERCEQHNSCAVRTRVEHVLHARHTGVVMVEVVGCEQHLIQLTETNEERHTEWSH